MTTQTDFCECIDVDDIEKKLESLFCAISNSNSKTCRNKARHTLSSIKESTTNAKHKKNNG